jgi:4-hydroxybenzoate polyprenyltransferase
MFEVYKLRTPNFQLQVAPFAPVSRFTRRVSQLTVQNPSAKVIRMTESFSSAAGSPAPPRFSWSAVSRLIRLQNQTGTLLLMLPTLWSLALAARGMPPLHLLAIFVTGSFVMRSAGVVLNDLADRSFDRHVTRTRVRPLASGELSPTHALLVVSFFLVLAGILVLLLDPFTILLSPIAVLLAGMYPFAKRVIHVPQAMLGIAFGWGTIMAWTASRGSIEAPAWCLFAATVCWAVGYDTIYALQDREDDRRIGVKSSALLFGSSTWIAVGAVFCAMLLLLGLAGWLAHIGWIYYVALAAVGLWCLRQALQLRQTVSAPTAFRMFQQHVWVGAVLFIGMIAGFLS